MADEFDLDSIPPEQLARLRVLAQVLQARQGGGGQGGLELPLSDRIRTRVPQLGPAGSNLAQGLPSGPQLNFFGGSAFPVNEAPQIATNSLVLAARTLRALRSRQDASEKAAKAAAKTNGS